MTDHHHHHRTRTGLRFRLYIGGKLHDETWIEADDPDSAADTARLSHTTARYHAEATAAAESEGFTWLVEVYDPAAPAAIAYLRFGTDVDGMVDPLPMIATTGVGGVVVVGGPLDGDDQ